MSNLVEFTVDGGLGHLAWNDPPANEMTGRFLRELGRIIREEVAPSGIGALLVYGKGRHFSSGARVDELVANLGRRTTLPADADAASYPSEIFENVRTLGMIAAMPFPVVAAINGVCLGLAFELSLHCGVRICGEGAVLGLPESSFNLMPGCGGAGRLAALCGRARAMELVLSGRTFSADEALSLGIAALVVPRRRLLDTAETTARRLAAQRMQKNSTGSL